MRNLPTQAGSQLDPKNLQSVSNYYALTEMSVAILDKYRFNSFYIPTMDGPSSIKLKGVGRTPSYLSENLFPFIQFFNFYFLFYFVLFYFTFG